MSRVIIGPQDVVAIDVSVPSGLLTLHSHLWGRNDTSRGKYIRDTELSARHYGILGPAVRWLFHESKDMLEAELQIRWLKERILLDEENLDDLETSVQGAGRCAGDGTSARRGRDERGGNALNARAKDLSHCKPEREEIDPYFLPHARDEIGHIPPLGRFTVLDLRELSIEDDLVPGLPKLILVRNEYEELCAIMQDYPCTGSEGSILLTGQPGVGKTCFLYYLLVDRLLKGKPTILQRSQLYIFSSAGVRILERGELPSDLFQGLKEEEDVWALVDGHYVIDGTPHSSVIDAGKRVRIIMAASSGPPENRRWIRRKNGMEYLMNPWTWRELFVVGHFMHVRHIEHDNLCKSVLHFGLRPRECFMGATNAMAFMAKRSVALKGAVLFRDVFEKVGFAAAVETLADVFETGPRDEARHFGLVKVRPASPWILDKLLWFGGKTEPDVLPRLFRSARYTPGAEHLASDMWRRTVHEHFSIGANAAFTARALDDSQTTSSRRQMLFASDDCDRVTIEPFENDEDLRAHLERYSACRAPCYLYPLNSSFPGIDSVALFTDGSVCVFQITIAESHVVDVSGLDRVQNCLPPDLRANAQPWSIIFIVPTEEELHYTVCQKFAVPGVRFADQESKERAPHVDGALGALPGQEPASKSRAERITYWKTHTRQFVLGLSPAIFSIFSALRKESASAFYHLGLS